MNELYKLEWMIGIKRLEPIKYWIVCGTETYSWWIFKKERFVAYVHSDLMSLGPFYSVNEAVSIKTRLENS